MERGSLAYCEGLTYADRSDWRLPDVNELKTIVDYTRYNPSIDETAFPGTPSNYFWSSTTSMNNTDRAWGVHFSNGNVPDSNKTNSYNVRCVR